MLEKQIRSFRNPNKQIQIVTLSRCGVDHMYTEVFIWCRVGCRGALLGGPSGTPRRPPTDYGPSNRRAPFLTELL